MSGLRARLQRRGLGALAALVQVLLHRVQRAGHVGAGGPAVQGPTASPAAAAGLPPGDVIVSVGGHAVTSAASLRSVLDAYHPGGKAVLCFVDQAGQADAATIVFTAGPRR